MSLFFPMLLTGLLTSFHCIMMCGNMVLSYAVKGNEEGTVLKRMVPHLAYHSAKIVSYTLVGLLLGSIGAFITQGARSWVAVLAGVYMVLLGLNMTGKFPVLARLTPRPPRFLMTAISKLRRRANSDAAQGESSITTPITFGLMTGLMPCGPLQAAQLAAAGAGSTLSGGVVMLGFGLGTIPLMLGYGLAASYLSGRFKKYMAVAAAIVVIVLGGVMINRGATALGSPVTFNTITQGIVGGQPVAVDESQFKTGADGVVEVPLVIENVQFQPSTLAIPADKPVRLIIERREDNACSEQLNIPQLGILAPLTPNGTTVVDIPAAAAGSYQLTCQMGMMSGTLQVGAAVAKSGGALTPMTILLFTLAAAGAWLYAARRKARRAAEEAALHKKGRRRNLPEPVPAPGLLGFSHVEIALGGAAVLIASFLGMLLGGYLV